MFPATNSEVQPWCHDRDWGAARSHTAKALLSLILTARAETVTGEAPRRTVEAALAVDAFAAYRQTAAPGL